MAWALLSLQSTHWAAGQNQPVFESQVVVVQFESAVALQQGVAKSGLEAFDRAAAPYGVTVIERAFPFLDFVQPTAKTARNLSALRRTYYVRYDADEAPTTVANTLSAVPEVVFAEPVIINRLFRPDVLVDPNDPFYSQQSYLQHLRLPQAWDTAKGEDGTPPAVIAIVDGGSDWRHEDLEANVWTNAGEIADNGLDDDGNGFIDDVHGVNFANDDASDNDPTGLPATPNNAAHGTMVAGAAGAVTNNGTGMAGAAWNADLMHINAGCKDSDGQLCYGYDGLLYAAANGADVINASWGGGVTGANLALVAQILDFVTDSGALVVAASGNDGLNIDETPYFPSSYPRVLSVGATEKDSRSKASYSNYGKTVNVFVPGNDIVGTYPGNQYALAEGTSLSAPLVAGVAALVKTNAPGLSPDELREQLRLTSESIDAVNPQYSGQLGRGYVNAESSLQASAHPAVRVKRWGASPVIGNGFVVPGEEVTVTATIVNYLANAQQLTIELIPAESYSFLQLTKTSHSVGSLAGGDSTVATFRFTVDSDAPAHVLLRFFTRVTDGSFTDEPDMFAALATSSKLEVAYFALGTLFFATDGNNWTNSAGWDFSRIPTEAELASWHGVSSLSGWVQGLDLNNNNLNGRLPPVLSILRRLETLSLWGNALNGPIPAEFGRLSELKVLALSSNFLTGAIPSALGDLLKLEELTLDNNTLSATIPEELGNLTQLTSLALHTNALGGNIPEELGSISQLTTLTLHTNSLSGDIPEELGNLSQLTTLALHSNGLSGVIPSTLGDLSQLRTLTLHDNALTGTVPPTLGSLAELLELDLEDNQLTGTIPAALGSLTTLHSLLLGDNALSGSIPPVLGDLAQLQRLGLGRNALGGTIPAELGSLPLLESLDLADNGLTGAIPAELGSLAQLLTLTLQGNQLSGMIPEELGSLSRLQSLDLSSNLLTGAIPAALGNLSELRLLDLSANVLSGRLPSSLVQLTNLRTLNFQDQNVCAPKDDAFQAWLLNIPNTQGPTCVDLQAAGIADQAFTVGAAVPAWQLPEASGGIAPFTYGLTPALPPGLHFDDSTRTISGIPTLAAGSATYTYKVVDASAESDSVTFVIEVVAAVSFADTVADQSFPRTHPIPPLVLPEATGGVPPITYTLTPDLPVGLSYEPVSRTISGTPTVVTPMPVPFAYRATGINGSADSLLFTIEVFSPVNAVHEVLPTEFALQGNYPNPFRHSTRLLLDLPWPANVTVEILDVIGRQMLVVPPQPMAAGWAQSLELAPTMLSSGLYWYRVHASSPNGEAVQAGQFIRIQ